MVNKLHSLFTPLAGAGLIEIVPQIELPTPQNAQSIVGLVLQIVIGLATLFKMFKKQKTTNTENHGK